MGQPFTHRAATTQLADSASHEIFGTRDALRTTPRPQRPRLYGFNSAIQLTPSRISRRSSSRRTSCIRSFPLHLAGAPAARPRQRYPRPAPTTPGTHRRLDRHRAAHGNRPARESKCPDTRSQPACTRAIAAGTFQRKRTETVEDRTAHCSRRVGACTHVRAERSIDRRPRSRQQNRWKNPFSRSQTSVALSRAASRHLSRSETLRFRSRTSP